jgi:hypothetical protein
LPVSVIISVSWGAMRRMSPMSRRGSIGSSSDSLHGVM